MTREAPPNDSRWKHKKEDFVIVVDETVFAGGRIQTRVHNAATHRTWWLDTANFYRKYAQI